MRKFRAFVPVQIEKSRGPNGEEQMRLRGIASTGDRDADGEILLPQGLDVRPFLSTGFLNWHHGKDPEAIIGEPVAAEVRNGALHIEAQLYADQPMAQKAWRLAKTLERSSKTRRLGYSIEGYAAERDPKDPKIVRRAVITGCALTPSPKNPRTIAEIVKAVVTDNDEFLKAVDEEYNRQERFHETMKAFHAGRLFRKGRCVKSEDEAMSIAYRRSGIEKGSADDPCWDGYSAYGMKTKNSKKVPNCVPKEKALDTATGQALLPESLDGSGKRRRLTKGQILDKIFERFSNITVSEAARLARVTHQLQYDMPAERDVTIDELEKARALLHWDGAPDDISKAASDDEDDRDGAAMLKYAQEKGLPMSEVERAYKKAKAKKKAKKAEDEEDEDMDDMDKGDLTISHDDDDDEDDEDMKSKGRKKAKQGGNGHGAADPDENLRKAYEDSVRKTDFLRKAYERRFGIVHDTKINALVTVLKSQEAEIASYREEVDQQQKLIKGLTERLDALEKATPLPKSALLNKANVRERFEKAKQEGEQSGFVTVNMADRKMMLGLLEKAAMGNGFDDQFGKALMTYESTGAVAKEVIQRLETEHKIKVIDPTNAA